MSKLRDLLEEEAAADLARIRSEADSKAEQIVRDAQEEASSRTASSRKRTEAAVRAAARRAQSASELTVSTARSRARGEVIDALREKALAALEGTASRADFGKVLRALAEEALAATAEGEAVVVHPDDREKIRKWAEEKALELRTDPTLRLGARIVGRSGRTVENTLPGRLNRAWGDLVARAARMLWE